MVEGQSVGPPVSVLPQATPCQRASPAFAEPDESLEFTSL